MTNVIFPLVADKSEIADSGGVYVANTYSYCFSPAEQKETAELICAAVNACRAINPDNPLAVANAMADAVAILPDLLNALESYHVAAQAEVIGEATARMLFEKDSLVIKTRAVLDALKGGSQ